jgi:hypothetical protein
MLGGFPLRGLRDSAEDLQEGRFPRTIATDDANDLAAFDLGGDVL